MQEDTDLAGIRDPEALQRFHEAGRDSWRALWEEVERLLTQAREAVPER